jgi:pantoate--beta-alanine ligase
MTARIIHSIAELKEALAEVRRAGVSIGLVPTMGALHAGHRSLIERSVRETGCTVVSVFVNPIQFNDAGDYKSYPRTLDDDARLCGEAGAAIVFAPSGEEIYPQPQRAFVEVESLTEGLCGAFRPGHFRGVATVVLKLFNIVQPDVAYFGQKDAQQLAVLRRMVADLNVPLRIVGVPIVREADGLAMSSRNRHLSPGERRVAPSIYQALLHAQARIAGGVSDPAQVRAEAVSELEGRGLRVEYFEIVDRDSMQRVDEVAGPALAATAVWLGSTRLIDNLVCAPLS